jgi:hypothetical protein
LCPLYYINSVFTKTICVGYLMTGLTVIIELEKTAYLGVVALPVIPHVWRYLLWIQSYEKHLDFMPATDTYNLLGFAVGQVVADDIIYYPASSIADCQQTDNSYYQDGEYLYIRSENAIAPSTIAVLRYGAIIGMTNTYVRRYNKITYLPDVVSVPSLDESVDPVEYSKMAFASGSAIVRNGLRYFDQKQDVFGNDCNVRIGEEGADISTFINLLKYYVPNYTVKTGQAVFALKDKRSLMSRKVPTTMFNATMYPNIESNKVGKIIPDAFGQLLGVPGICVNGAAGNVNKVFKFGTTITTATNVYVYRNEQWEVVTPVSVDNANGTVTLSVANSHDGGTYTSGILDVKMDGVFRPEANPGEIIKKINSEYMNLDFLANYYDIDEFTNELSVLPNIGLYMDKAKDVFEWIEQIQNGSVVGFQYLMNYGKVTARLDNPNRTPNEREIHASDITNITDVEIDFNAEVYASSAKIGYATDYDSGDSKYHVNVTYRGAVLAEHRVEKEYETESLLLTEAEAIDKSEIIMDDQKTIRPIYKNIRVHGLEWFSVKLYDIVYANIKMDGTPVRVPDSRETIRFTAEPGVDEYESDLEHTDIYNMDVAISDFNDKIRWTKREFAGYVRCQVIGRAFDLAGGNVTLTLRKREYSAKYAEIMGA